MKRQWHDDELAELHMRRDTIAIGPVITGLLRVSAGKKFRWGLA